MEIFRSRREISYKAGIYVMARLAHEKTTWGASVTRWWWRLIEIIKDINDFSFFYSSYTFIMAVLGGGRKKVKKKSTTKKSTTKKSGTKKSTTMSTNRLLKTNHIRRNMLAKRRQVQLKRKHSLTMKLKQSVWESLFLKMDMNEIKNSFNELLPIENLARNKHIVRLWALNSFFSRSS